MSAKLQGGQASRREGGVSRSHPPPPPPKRPAACQRLLRAPFFFFAAVGLSGEVNNSAGPLPADSARRVGQTDTPLGWDLLSVEALIFFSRRPFKYLRWLRPGWARRLLKGSCSFNQTLLASNSRRSPRTAGPPPPRRPREDAAAGPLEDAPARQGRRKSRRPRRPTTRRLGEERNCFLTATLGRSRSQSKRGPLPPTSPAAWAKQTRLLDGVLFRPKRFFFAVSLRISPLASTGVGQTPLQGILFLQSNPPSFEFVQKSSNHWSSAVDNLQGVRGSRQPAPPRARPPRSARARQGFPRRKSWQRERRPGIKQGRLQASPPRISGMGFSAEAIWRPHKGPGGTRPLCKRHI